jgi:hypothetical protein
MDTSIWIHLEMHQWIHKIQEWHRMCSSGIPIHPIQILILVPSALMEYGLMPNYVKLISPAVMDARGLYLVGYVTSLFPAGLIFLSSP